MKTLYSIPDIEDFLSRHKGGFISGSIKQLVEGQTSQVFSFENDQHEVLVIRIRENRIDFDADSYASLNFSESLPIPKILKIGSFDRTSFYAISPFISGTTLNTLSPEQFRAVLPGVKDMLVKTFQADISNTTGYGDPDFVTGNASALSWKDSLKRELEELDINKLKEGAMSIGLSDDTVDLLVNQFIAHLPYVSEHRRLLHGDPGGDNVIVKDGSIVALLDWEQMSYGDWMRDFSRFEFWNTNNYGDAEEFAKTNDLEANDIKSRKAVYWAINALRNIEFAYSQKNKNLASWMSANLQRIIL